MKRKHLYVIGPVTGKPDRNRAAFEEARGKLEAAGYKVTIPHDFIPEDALWGMAMRASLARILKRKLFGVATLAGWRESEGARLEEKVARATDVLVMPVDIWASMKGDRE